MCVGVGVCGVPECSVLPVTYGKILKGQHVNLFFILFPTAKKILTLTTHFMN